ATGRVLEVFARPGDVVELGARLFVVDSADLGAAKADYAKAVADVERSAAAARLSRELFDAQAVAQKELREAENDARKAVAERERAASRLQTLGVSPAQLAEIAARADSATTIVVKAPRGGVVVERNVTPGQVVAYGQSDTPVNLFVVADLGTMWVVADVYEPDVPRLRRDQPMVATLRCCPGERYEGRVSYISDAVDKETRTVKVRSVVVNRGRTLKAEMFVNVAIATGATRALALVLTAAGIVSYHRLPIEAYPDVGDVKVEVITLWPGHAAEEVERLITVPLENELNGIADVTFLRSDTLFGLSNIKVLFADGTDNYWARQQAQERITQADLPADAKPALGPLSSVIGEIFRYTLESKTVPLVELKAVQNWVLEREFRKIPGVADVVSWGGGTKQYQVNVDPSRLRGYNLTLKQVFDAVAA